MATTTAAHCVLKGLGMNAPSELPEEFWRVVDRYRAELLNQACAILGNMEDAEDAVQETFCKAFRQPARLAQADSLGAWLRVINRAQAIDLLRKRRLGQLGASGRTAQRALAATTGGINLFELRDAVARAIELLPQRHRTLVVMRYWEGLSCEEIAARVSAPLGTVHRLLFEAEQKLHGKLRRYLGQGTGPQEPAGSAEPSVQDKPQE